MFSVLIYLSLPIVFLLHDVEETLLRRWWAERNTDSISSRFPFARPMLEHLRNMSTNSFCIIVAEELLLIILAAVCAIYGTTKVPLCALTWGFCIHLVVHIGQAVAVRSYVPGLITSLLLIPYIILAIADLLQQYYWHENLLMASLGTMIVIVNLLVMHRIMRIFVEKET